ncbi:MAG TPA: P-loop domain-containing protein [Candidatus Polarisedimenticolaceae bacterium]|nr:P-loop domain-containing protein [Candidatus Polarisedimenticolaceae bacterium]
MRPRLHPVARAEPGLAGLLGELDGQFYAEYRQLVGRHALGPFTLEIVRVPADPLSGPATVSVSLPRADAGLPPRLVDTRARRIAVEDCLARAATRALADQLARQPTGGPGAGRVEVAAPGPTMIERSTCRITERDVQLRLAVTLPAAGRRIRGLQARELFRSVERLATATLLFSTRRGSEAERAVAVIDGHRELQQALAERGLVAFVADGSVLARRQDDDGPHRGGLTSAFAVPDELSTILELPGGERVRGLGIPAGVTLIVGGALHGKTTLLEALASGVRPHAPDDGRERVAAIEEAVLLRAENGRSVRRVDVSGFLHEPPAALASEDVSLDAAGGALACAAGLAEAVELGVRLLLIDEDRCPPSFLQRDARMQRLVPAEQDPLTPLVDRVRELYERLGVSTVLATGSAGDYLEMADTVIEMRDHRPCDASARARRVVVETRGLRRAVPRPALQAPAVRRPRLDVPADQATVRPQWLGPLSLRAGGHALDLRVLEGLVEPGEVCALALLLGAAARRADGRVGLRELLEQLERGLDASGLDALDPPLRWDLARPRRFELAAALNRWTALGFERDVRPAAAT